MRFQKVVLIFTSFSVVFKKLKRRVLLGKKKKNPLQDLKYSVSIFFKKIFKNIF